MVKCGTATKMIVYVISMTQAGAVSAMRNAAISFDAEAIKREEVSKREGTSSPLSPFSPSKRVPIPLNRQKKTSIENEAWLTAFVATAHEDGGAADKEQRCAADHKEEACVVELELPDGSYARASQVVENINDIRELQLLSPREEGIIAVRKALLEKRFNKKNANGVAWVYRAAQLGCIEELAQFLDNGIDPDFKDDNGRSLLYAASDRGYVDTVRYLLINHHEKLSLDSCIKAREVALQKGYESIAHLFDVLVKKDKMD